MCLIQIQRVSLDLEMMETIQNRETLGRKKNQRKRYQQTTLSASGTKLVFKTNKQKQQQKNSCDSPGDTSSHSTETMREEVTEETKSRIGPVSDPSQTQCLNKLSVQDKKAFHI